MRWLAVSLLAVLLPATAWPYAYTSQPAEDEARPRTDQPQGSGEPVVWRDPDVTLTVKFEGDYNDAVRSAMNEWSAVSGSTLRWFSGRSRASLCNAEDDVNVTDWAQSFAEDTSVTCNGKDFGDALAVTTRTYVRPAGEPNTFYLADIAIAVDQNRHWTADQSGPLLGSSDQRIFDFRRVMLHELGHALGLDHPDTAGQNVNAIMNSQTGNLDNLQADDKEGLRFLYPSDEAPTDDVPVTDGDNGGGGGSLDMGVGLLASLVGRRLSWQRPPVLTQQP